MPHQYSAENHDWDLTLRAAWALAVAGQVQDQVETPYSSREKQFACFTGSMLLSFCAVESFSASIAFAMPKTGRFNDFDFEQYRRKRAFWDRIQQIFEAIPYTIDRSRGLFQKISQMQDWRNLVTHSTPYEIAKTEIADTTTAPTKLHVPLRHKQFSRRVKLENAQEFYRTSLAYIALLKDLTGLEPRASATFVIGNDEAPKEEA
jgi:hypothetical protein